MCSSSASSSTTVSCRRTRSGPFYVDPTALGVHGVPDTAKYSCAPCNQRLCLFEDCEVLLDRIAKLDYVLTDDVSDELDIFQSRLRRLRHNCNKYFAHLGRDAHADKYQASVSKNLKPHQVKLSVDYIRAEAQ